MTKNPGEWLYEIVRNNFQGKPPWDRLCLEDQLSWEAIAKEIITKNEEELWFLKKENSELEDKINELENELEEIKELEELK